MTYHAGVGQVLIKPDPDFIDKDGFLLDDEDVSNLNVTGTIIDVGPVTDIKFSSYVNEWTKAYNREMPKVDCPEITPLKSGERIVFSFFTKLDPTYIEDLLLIEYGAIFGAGTPLKGVNGYSLIRMAEKEKIEDFGGFFIENFDVNDYGVGYDGEELVFFNPRLAARLELDMHNSLNKGGQSSLFKIKKTNLWHVKR